MKKIALLVLVLMVCSLAFADDQAELREQTGIELKAPNKINHTSTSRDIPHDGLLLIPDSNNDRVMAFYPNNGDLYDEDFIASDPTNLSTPIVAGLHPDGNSILVSDQVKDGVIEYDLDGNFVGWFAPAGGVNTAILDNVRGWAAKPDGHIIVACASGTNSDAIAEFDGDGNYLSNFIPPNAAVMDGPFGILYRESQNDYLIGSSTSDAVHQFDNTGTFLGNLVPSINFPEQISETPSGNLLVAGFSSPSGCYEYTSDGTYVGYYDVVTGLRGVYEIGNGNILVTNGSGVYEINRSNQLVSTKIEGISGRFITFVPGDGGVGVDDPAHQSMICNFPNPVRNVTTISFVRADIQQNTFIKIYNTRGQLVQEIPIGGETHVEWNGKDANGNAVSSGIYFYTLQTVNGVISNKLLLLR